MSLRPGDRLADEAGEWEVLGRPYSTGGGKTVHAWVQRVGGSEALDGSDLGSPRESECEAGGPNRVATLRLRGTAFDCLR